MQMAKIGSSPSEPSSQQNRTAFSAVVTDETKLCFLQLLFILKKCMQTKVTRQNNNNRGWIEINRSEAKNGTRAQRHSS